MVLSEKGRQYKQAIAEYVSVNNVPKYGEAKLRITMILQPKDKRRIDIDNRIKCVLDSLQEAGVFDDDFHVDELHVLRGEQVKGGRLLLTIETIEDKHD
jgi:crossover junction endodeoxyribonuclease RusA